MINSVSETPQKHSKEDDFKNFMFSQDYILRDVGENELAKVLIKKLEGKDNNG